MRSYLPRVVGTAIVGLLILLLFLLLPATFLPFDYAAPEKPLIPLEGDVNAALSRVLWTDRQLDVMVMAVLLVVTGVCCSTLLRSDRGDAP